MKNIQDKLAFRFLAAAALLTILRGAMSAAAERESGAADCGPMDGLTFICGLSVPEDVVNVGSSGMVLASGHRAPGHLYLINPATGAVQELIQGPAFRQQHDRKRYPACPGPLNLKSFDVHGMSIGETAPNQFSIYTTSHGEREAIEIYELNLGGATPVLTWTGCVPLQQDGYFNSVVRLADGGFVVTRMRDVNAATSSIAPGQISGRLFEWHPGGELKPLPGTELSLPNGLEVSDDGRYVFVAASGTRELVRFDLRATPIEKRAVSLPFHPDNVHWDSQGRLIIAGPNFAPGSCTGSNCPSGWTVADTNPAMLTFTRLGGGSGMPSMARASAAIRVGKEIWVANNQDRIARFTPP
jgi:hypothetical protein